MLLHCEEHRARTYLKEIVDCDVVVGVAGFESEWPRLVHHQGTPHSPLALARPAAEIAPRSELNQGLATSETRLETGLVNGPGPTDWNTSLNSDSIESGLITVVCEGNESYFNRSRAEPAANT